MALDFGDALDLLRNLADWPTGSGDHGPARKRVGRWSVRAFWAIAATTAVALFIVWLRADDFAAFDRDGLAVAALAALALFALLVIHVVAAIVANAMDRRRGPQP